MKKVSILVLACILVYCNVHAQGKDIPYTRAKHYFVNNNYPDRHLHMKKITEEDVFNGIFGAASVMGPNGQATRIDFSKSFVIALIDDINTNTTDLYIRSLKKVADKLDVIYQIEQSDEPGSMMRRYAEIIIVDKSYMGKVSARRYNPSDTPLMGDDLDEDGCKPSTGHIWSIITNDCITPWTTKFILEGPINNANNAALLFNETQSEAEIIGSSYGKNIILAQIEKNKWTKGDLILTEIERDHFILQEAGKEIAKGKLRDL